MKNLSIKSAAYVNMISKYTVIFLNLFITAILARLLTPEEYGIVAIVNVFVAFFAILADLGIGNAVVQNQSLSEKDIQNIFFWSLKRAVLLGLIFVCLAVPIAYFYSNDVYLKIVPLLGIAVVFTTANTVPAALLTKSKKFVLIGLRTVTVCIVCAFFTIILAMFGFSYYALVFNTILSGFLNLIWNLKGSGLTIFSKISGLNESIDKIRNFSTNLFKFNVINYFARNSDNLLIGKFLGAVELGYYNKAYQLMLYPMNNLTNVITPVLLPYLSSRKDDANYVYSKYIQTVKVLSLLGMYISVFSYFCSYELVVILFGKNWIMTVPCFQYLSISIWAQMICATAGTMFQVLDNTKGQFNCGLVTSTVTVTAIVFGVILGDIESISVLVMLAYLSHFITVIYFLVHKTFKKSWIVYIKMFVPDFIIGVIVAISLFLLNLINIESVLLSFIIKLTISGVLYLLLLVLSKELKHLSLLFPAKLKKFCIKIKILD